MRLRLGNKRMLNGHNKLLYRVVFVSSKESGGIGGNVSDEIRINLGGHWLLNVRRRNYFVSSYFLQSVAKILALPFSVFSPCVDVASIHLRS